MIRTVLSASIVSLLVAPLALAGDSPAEKADAYIEKANAVVEALNTDGPDAEAIVLKITDLLEDAKTAITHWGTLHTQCVEQLAKVIELYPEIDTWTPQEIRRNIETGASLPQARGCYAGRDVVAHPAIVRAIARTGITAENQARLRAEMAEAIEHMTEIRAEFGDRE